MGDAAWASTLGRALRMPWSDRRRHLEAVAALTRASLELRIMPSRRTVGLLGILHREADTRPVERAQLGEAMLVGQVVARDARRLPWHPTCLRQALAVQRMLQRRGIPSRIHLGVRSSSELAAHAWVTVGDQPVVGGHGVEQYVPLAAFG
jgi:hypothetical protein